MFAGEHTRQPDYGIASNMIRKLLSQLVRALFVLISLCAVVASGYVIFDNEGGFTLVSIGFGLPLYFLWLMDTAIKHAKLSIPSLIRPTRYLFILVFSAFCLDSLELLMHPQMPVRMIIDNDLKQIQNALHNYQDAHGSLPAAFTRSPDGRPLLSWRVLLLPYLDAGSLYTRFHVDEPWDSAHNQSLLADGPKCYVPEFLAAPAPGMTFFRVFEGPGAPFDGDKGLNLKTDFMDAPRTLFVVEAREAVPWTKPEDLVFGPDTALPELGAPRLVKIGPIRRSNGLPERFSAAMVDGSVR